MKKIIILISLVLILTPLFCNENDETIFVSSIEWELVGRDRGWQIGSTKQKAIEYFLRIEEGDSFKSDIRLIEKLERQLNDLKNRKIYREVSYSISYSEVDGIMFADIKIRLVDALTFYIVPLWSYNSTRGHLVGGEMQWENAFGSIFDFKIDGYWTEPEWQVRAEISEIPLWGMATSLLFLEKDETVLRTDDDGYVLVQYRIMKAVVDLGFDISFRNNIGWNINPGLYFPHTFRLEENNSSLTVDEIKSEEPGTTITLDSQIYWDKLEWETFFREGFKISLENNYTAQLSPWLLISDIQLDFIGFWSPNEYFSLSGRLGGFYVMNGIRDASADRIRGVLDYKMYGDLGLFLNLNCTFRVLRVEKVFEIHLTPFIDIGYVDTLEFSEYGSQFAFTGGFSLSVFPIFLESYHITFDLGFDILNPGEIEIMIYSNLFF